MGLREVVNHWVMPPIFNEEIRPDEITKTSRQVSRILGDVVQRDPDEYTLVASYQELLAEFMSRKSLDHISGRLLRHTPLVMFKSMGEGDPKRLIEIDGFLDAYLTRLRLNANNRAVLSLATELLRTHRRVDKYISLYIAVVDLLNRACTSQRCVKYRSANDHFSLFEENGPKKVWDWYADQVGNIEQRLSGSELPEGIVETGFFDEVVRAAIHDARNNLGTANFGKDKLDSLAVLQLEDSRYDSLRIDLAHALLLPFKERNIESIELRDSVREFILSYFGDPRVTRDRWFGVDSAAEEVILHWLVEDTIEAFFQLIQYVSRGNSDLERQWPYREKFWNSYLHRGVVQGAWVVLSPNIDPQALRMLKLDRDGYGMFSSNSGLLHNHVALILRIGNLVITDWNYNGKYRVWNEDIADPEQSPKLYKNTYMHKDRLISGAQFDGAHHATENYTWQKTLSKYISDKAGITMPEREYRLRSTGRARRHGGLY